MNDLATLPEPLLFEYAGQPHPVRLSAELAPRTVQRLLAALPAEVDIHCAKIAGNHIFWHAPFVAPLERATDILSMPPGAFVYWPERQFLELIYAPLQAETASVNVLGWVDGDTGWLRALGETVQRRQGHELVCARLSHPAAAAADLAPGDPLLAELHATRVAAWQAPPPDVEVLMARRGVMLPYGPLAMAEGELRKLHELLWRLHGQWQETPAPQVVTSARFLLTAAVERVAGFCGMHETGAVLMQASRLLEGDAGCVAAALEELVLYTGRMAAWLDQCIPWHDLNEVVLGCERRRSR